MANHPSAGKGFFGAVEVGDVIVHMDVFTSYFCCDISACHGRCCEEGDAGAPVSFSEVAEIENQLDTIWPLLSAQAQAVIDRQGVAYTDAEGDVVTSIVNGCDCVFRGPAGCVLKQRPISCHLYPIREKRMGSLTGLNYHRWDICRDAVRLGTERGIRMYEFLREPLVRRFGEEWYAELLHVAGELHQQGLIE